MAAACTVLNFAPHPDDELLGAPATLMALRDAGWRVVNVAVSLGRPADHDRRRQEVEEATRRAGFELIVPPDLAHISSSDDRATGRAEVRAVAERALAELRPDVVVSPSPHDRHHGHEIVARGVSDAVRSGGDGPRRWWLSGWWASLPLPTLGTVFDEPRLVEIVHALEAHVGELDRADYRRALEGRGEMNAVLGPELLFGFGAEANGGAYVELLTEIVAADGRCLLGRARWLDVAEWSAAPSQVDVASWLDAPSVADRFGPPGSQNQEERL